MNTEKTYKWSLYNIAEQDKDGILLFNTLSKKLVLLGGDVEREYNVIKKSDILNESPLVLKLLERGFVVKTEFDERRYCDFKYYTKIFSGNVLDLTIIPTEKCNFRCQYCYEKERFGTMTQNTADNIIKYLHKNLRYYKELSIDWFGGEPLLAKDLIVYMMTKIKRMCRENGVLLSCIMATNGYELSLDTFEKLVNSGVRAFHISLDGSKETHNVQRPHKTDGDSYTKILNNLIEISKKYVSNKDRFTIDIRMNVSKYNICAVNEFVEMYEKNFINDKRFNLVWQWVRDWGGERIAETLMNKELISENDCTKLYEYSLSKGIKSDERLSCNSGREYCGACKLNGFVIDFDGKIYKCSMAKDKQEYRDRALIGEIDNYGVLRTDEIKHSEWVLPRKIKEECDSCPFYPMCMGAACPLSDNIIHKQSQCIVYRSSIGQQIRNKRLHNKYEILD